MIYRLFLEGDNPTKIAKILTKKKMLTPTGKKKWYASTVLSILKNEKYKGDARLQKTFTVDFLTKKMKINEGEVPQYYVENSHPGIISREVYDLAQHELKKRKESRGYKTGDYVLSGMLVCGDCGSFFGSKVWHSNDKYRRVIWQCNSRFKNKERCKTPNLKGDKIKDAFVEVFNSIIDHRDEIIGNYEDIIDEIINGSQNCAESIKLQRELDRATKQLTDCVDENAVTRQLI